MTHPKRARARKPISVGVLTASLALSGTASAQMLEEVVVTAQKRVESLQDVPISITAVSGEKMSEAGVFKVEDLQTFTPNLSMTETGISTQMYIRGIGSGNNQGFELSVGQYLDGIYYGRQQLIRLPFLDLERVEVLRGPQSILFGKNSIAGALNMTTAKPTDEFEARIGGAYSDDSDIIDVQGVISGPITENLSGRLVGRWYEEDGFVDNSFNNQDEPEREEWGLRGALRWDATDNLRVDFKAEYHEFDVNGRQIEIVRDDPALTEEERQEDFPWVEPAPIPGANFQQILGLLGQPDAITENRQNNERQADTGDSSSNEMYNYTLNVDWGIGDLTFTSLTGFVGYEFDELCDCDFIGAPVFEAPFSEDYEQFSQEFRLVSPGGETIDWIAGVFYQTSELDFIDAVVVPENSILGAASSALIPILGTESGRVFESDSDLWAVFAQATWNINDAWRLTVGGRYTEETKEGSRKLDIINSATGEEVSQGIAQIYKAVFNVDSEQLNEEGHDLNEDRDESIFTPLVTVQWDVNPDIMLYASASTGFKAGGFDARSNIVESFEFEEEEATTYEIGGKTIFADGAAELNFAIYRTDYDDLQVSQFDGVIGFTVGNAAETRVQGVEIDGRWAITDNLVMGYGLAYLDHEFKDFTNGNCFNRQEPDGDIVEGIQLCDYTGKRGQYTPEWTSTLTFTHTFPISNSLDLQSGLDLNYVDEQNTEVNLNPLYEVDSITKVNLRFGLYHNNWDVAVLAQNITDEQQLTYVSNSPLSATTFGTNTFYSFVSRPRTVYLQANYHF
ncbi:MAG: TonB-dependent receptor [Pseudomonadota bacterium]